MSNTYWKDAKEWVCPNHLPSLHIPASVGVCLFTSCNSLRPRNRPPGLSDTDIHSMNISNTLVKKEPMKRKSRTIIVSDESFEEIEEPSESYSEDSSENSAESSSEQVVVPPKKDDAIERTKEKKSAIDEKLEMIEARILAKKLAKQAAQEQVSLFPVESQVDKKEKKQSKKSPSVTKAIEIPKDVEEKIDKEKSKISSKSPKLENSKTKESKEKTSGTTVETTESQKTDKSIRKKKNKVAGDEHYCDWFQCNKGKDGKRGLTPINSKYCSKDCSNKNARWRYKQRQNDDE